MTFYEFAVEETGFRAQVEKVVDLTVGTDEHLPKLLVLLFVVFEHFGVN